MTKKEISYLKNTYPEIITKEQFYKICHISKRTASFLLESGLVKNFDSGKRTRKYKIQLDDVIEFLILKEQNKIHYKAPENYYKENTSKKPKIKLLTFNEEQIEHIKNYIVIQMEKYSDVLDLKEISKIIGYSYKTIYEWYIKQEIKGFIIKNKVTIPKEYLIDFLISKRAFNIAKKSTKHVELLNEAILNTQ